MSQTIACKSRKYVILLCESSQNIDQKKYKVVY